MAKMTHPTRPTICNRLSTGLLAAGLCLTHVAVSAGPPPDLGQLEPARLAEAPETWAVLDARPPTRWADGHIPGAQPFYWGDHTRTDPNGVRYRLLPAEDLAASLGRMGIEPTTPVIVYGDADTSWGGEGWAAWVLTWLGHTGPVRLLAGGIQAWRAENLPLTTGEEPPDTAKTYRVSLRPEALRTMAQLRPLKPGEVLVDTRSALEWFGGRLPGAIRLSWKKLYRGPNRRHLEPETYRDLLARSGITPQQTPVFYCSGGIRSAYAWLVHQLAEAGPAANFEGGTEAWNTLKARP